MKPSLIIVCALLGSFAVTAAEPEEFVWVFPLDTDQNESVWRVPLNRDVVDSLNRVDGRDLMVTDADGHAVPFQRLPRSFLVEDRQRQQTLEFDAAPLVEESPDRPPLQLRLEHDGTRLTIQSPSINERLSDQSRLVFEALIAAADAIDGLPDHSLSLHFTSPQPIALDCRLRDADDDRPASRRLTLAHYGDSRPRQYRGTVEMDQLPQAWHLGCYGASPVPELVLVAATLVSRGQLDHRRFERIDSEATPIEDAPGQFEFSLAGPYLLRSIGLTSTEPNLVSSIRFRSRPAPDQPWRERGRFELTTLVSAPPATLQLDRNNRDRHWQLSSEPPLRRAPQINLEAEVEELAFLAQGAPPWRLYAGSRQAVEPTASGQLLSNAVQSLGPAWRWPRQKVGPRHESAGPAALEQPPEEVPWERYLLWLVLLVGALLVAVIAVRLLTGQKAAA